jgi:hypothetical protein
VVERRQAEERMRKIYKNTPTLAAHFPSPKDKPLEECLNQNKYIATTHMAPHS